MHVLLTPDECRYAATHPGAVEDRVQLGTRYAEAPNARTLEETCEQLMRLTRTEPRVLLTLRGDDAQDRALLAYARRVRTFLPSDGRNLSTQYLIDARWRWRSTRDANTTHAIFTPSTSPILVNPLPRAIGEPQGFIDGWGSVCTQYATTGIAFYQFVQDEDAFHRYAPIIEGIVLHAPLGAQDAQLLRIAHRELKGAIVRV